MEEKLLKFICKNNLEPFNQTTSLINFGDSIFRTKDAKIVCSKVLQKLSNHFCFKSTKKIFEFFSPSTNGFEILNRQGYFKSFKKEKRDYLKKLAAPKKSWSPKYDSIAVTEEESTFLKLKEMNCPVQFINSENDIMHLEKYDIVKIVDCPNYGRLIERLPQSVLIKDIEDANLEGYLEMLSCWNHNLNILKRECQNEKIMEIAESLLELLELIKEDKLELLTVNKAEEILMDINEKINSKLKSLTISGESLVKIISEGKIPEEISDLIGEEIKKSGLSENLFNIKIPLELDYRELESQIKIESASKFSNFALKIKLKSEELRRVPEKLKNLKARLLIEDFKNFLNAFKEGAKFPLLSQNLHLSNAKNILLEKPDPIDFQLDDFSKASILTGANSGGKTTLIEHIVQAVCLFQMGLPVNGEAHFPIFTDVYYFAKNKGSASRGAFETLLTQISKIRPGKRTLILADEIEAVTEPGVAGKIISATVDYFVKKGCFLVIATHLGQEIVKTLPEKTRIDGIEALGLDENFNLIVNHNPILGKLAHSTPELIIEKLSKLKDNDYLKFLNQFISNDYF